MLRLNIQTHERSIKNVYAFYLIYDICKQRPNKLLRKRGGLNQWAITSTHKKARNVDKHVRYIHVYVRTYH